MDRITGRRPVRAGFTLVELLVVIAIIGVLVALLLPAVQAAREAARRSQCSNNLKQFGLAMHNYHDIYNVFPPRRGGTGAGNPNGNSSRRSAFIYLLPFLEQKPLFDQVEAPLTNPAGTTFNAGGPGAWYNTAPPNHYPPWCAQLKVVLCPSDKPVLQVDRQAKHSYAFSMGDKVGADLSGGNARWNVNADSNPRGIFHGNQRQRGFNHITDGSSNTIAISERVHHFQTGITPSAGHDIRVAAVSNFPSVLTSPGTCFSNVTAGRYTTGVQIKGRFGFLWADGQAERVGFNTVLPPNGPACLGDDNVNADSQGGAMPPASYHPNGVMAVFADGSVRFVTNNINTGNLSAPPVAMGPSPYGVWGALGSIDGNESIANF